MHWEAVCHLSKSLWQCMQDPYVFNRLVFTYCCQPGGVLDTHTVHTVYDRQENSHSIQCVIDRRAVTASEQIQHRAVGEFAESGQVSFGIPHLWQTAVFRLKQKSGRACVCVWASCHSFKTTLECTGTRIPTQSTRTVLRLSFYTFTPWMGVSCSYLSQYLFI